MNQTKLKELLEEFAELHNLDIQVSDCATRGVIATVYFENKTVVEWCPHCEQEVNLERPIMCQTQSCPECKKRIKPCALCRGCGDCVKCER